MNDALLERAARLLSACLVGIVELRHIPRGGRVLICVDGTTIRKNPLLRPKIERYLAQYALDALGVAAEFCFTDDATLLGSAWAGLIGE